MAIEIRILLTTSITEVEADALILKNAEEGQFGPEEAVNRALVGTTLEAFRRSDLTRIGATRVMTGLRGIATDTVVLVGVGPGFHLRYETVDTLCTEAVRALHEAGQAPEVVATVAHGVGFGLDKREVLRTELFAFKAALERYALPSLKKILINSISPSEHARLEGFLHSLSEEEDSPIRLDGSTFRLEVGKHSTAEDKAAKRLQQGRYIFVAMPFDKEFENTYDFGIRLPIEQVGCLPIRTDQQYFSGSVDEEIRRRIDQSTLVVADVTGANPNVMFEIGYAQGREKPTVLVCRQGETLPFDIRQMSTLFYDPQLLRELNTELQDALSKLLSGHDP